MKLLNELIENAPEVPVQAISQDSRTCEEGTMYFCIKGQRNDGHSYISQAIEKGATIIVHSDEIQEKAQNVVYIRVEDTMKALNEITDKYYDHPSKLLKMVGVTGTNGKSTVSYVTSQLLNRLGLKTGYIGTIDVSYGLKSFHTNYTTPETVQLLSILSDMVKNNMNACSMEVSSSGLDFHRVDSIDYDVAIYTNLSHEHLDVHGTMENYALAKSKLFSMLKKEAYAVLNMDDEYFEYMKEHCDCHVLTYSLYKSEADLLATNIVMSATQTTFTLHYLGSTYDVKTNLLSSFNVANLLGAIGGALALGYTVEDIIACVDEFKQVKGRMEMIQEGQPFRVIVDYAHTPDSFEKIFPYARTITPAGGHIISLFGSAGHRDSKKRPIMGEIADKYSDLIILTEDDYRTEDPKEIADEIRQGIKKHRTVFFSQRQTAITQAIEMARPNDTILLLGKGEDAYMAVGNERLPYPGDQIIARLAIKRLLQEISEDDMSNDKKCC